MLAGRLVERERIDQLVAGARDGDAGVLVLAGEPGIGKTTLLDAAVERASGFRVLRASGVESEAGLPYAGLLELLRPVLDRLDDLPRHQASALRGAFALDEPAPDEQFAVSAATLSLLAVVAEREPLLVVVDDAHWLDEASSHAIAFAARRLGADPVAVLVALRAGEGSAGWAAYGFPELELTGLDRDFAHELLTSAGGDISPAVVDELVRATDGNPLGLAELARLLTPAQRTGAQVLDMPLPASGRIVDLFGRRIAALPSTARRALLVVAADDTGDAAVVSSACRALGLDDDALDSARDEGLVSVVERRVSLRHPLVRAAAYTGASEGERRNAHRALADALAAFDPDRSAWHQAHATTAPDEEVAAALEAAATHASAGSPRAAARAYELAARLTPDPETKARRLLEAARGSERAGRLDVGALLEEAAALAAAPALLARIEHLQGRVEAAAGSALDGAALLERAAGRLAGSEPTVAAWMLADAVDPWSLAGAFDKADEAASRAAALASQADGLLAAYVSLRWGDARCLAGDEKGADERWLRGAAAVLADDGLRRDPEAGCYAAECLASAGRYDDARSVVTAALDGARRQGALGLLPHLLDIVCLVEGRSGRLVSAASAGAESVELLRAFGHRVLLAEALGRLAWVEGMLGREPECRAHTDEARELGRRLGYGDELGGHGLGLLALSLGRSHEAVEVLEQTVAARGSRIDVDAFAARPVLACLVEAYVRAGRVEDARAALERVASQAEGVERADVRARASRARALVETEEQFFLEALAWNEQAGNPFEQARTLLCFGELLRRQRRRAEARVQLRAALSRFEDVGATSWADRARVELRASGARARRRDPSTVDQLTPQELQVARLVAGGLSNREAAAHLFLSPKTIETHLGHVYRKVGVRSRSALTVRLAELDLLGEPSTVSGDAS